MGHVKGRSNFHGLLVVLDGVVALSIPVRLHAAVKLLHRILRETAVVVGGIYQMGIAASDAVGGGSPLHIVAWVQMNLHHVERRDDRIHVGQFVYSAKGRVVNHDVVRIRFQIIEAKAPLIIRVDTGNRGPMELELYQDRMGRKVTPGNAQLSDDSSQLHLS